MRAAVGDIAAAVFLLALVALLVRPNSLAPAFVKEVGGALDALVKYAVSG